MRASSPVSMRKDNRPYFVCKHCKDSWIYCHKAETEKVCSKCGATWPKFKKPNPMPTGENARERKEWTQPRRAPKKQNVAQRALRTVWEHLPAQVKDTIENAGWSPPEPPAPPGLAPASRSTVRSQPGSGRGGTKANRPLPRT